MGTLKHIHVYPIKSCRGITLDTAALEDRGFGLDRRWMLIDEQSQFLSQRNTAQLSQIDIAIQGDALKIQASGFESLVVPFDSAKGDRIRSQIWKDEVEGIHVDEQADIWFSHVLRMPVRLVHMDASVMRPLKKDRLPQDRDFEVSFADGYPYLLTNQSSLDDLNARLSTPISMDRFRANLVLKGFPAFAEDTWKRIRIGSGEFLVVKPCARCKITTIDQQSGMASREPLKTLASYRKSGAQVLFGMNLVSLNHTTIHSGDAVTILEKN